MQAGHGTVEQIGEVVLTPGAVVRMLPSGIHSAHLDGDAVCRTLLLYGARLREALVFDPATGTCEIYRVPNVRPA